MSKTKKWSWEYDAGAPDGREWVVYRDEGTFLDDVAYCSSSFDAEAIVTAMNADAAPETDAVGAALRVKCPSCETDVTGAWATGADECPQGCDWPFDAVHLVFEWGDDVQAFIAAIQSIYPERYRAQQPTEQGR